jgi:4'-phosphopantetheinyl transferase
MVRRMLGAHFGRPPAAVAIRLGEHGKPWAPPPAGRPVLHFNIAHAGDLVLAAFSLRHEVGVDVEVIQAAPEWAAIAPRLMSPAAHRDWLALAPAEQTQAFFAAWTSHEAALKALGSGLTDDFTLPVLPVLQQAKLELPAGYAGALAYIAKSL